MTKKELDLEIREIKNNIEEFKIRIKKNQLQIDIWKEDLNDKKEELMKQFQNINIEELQNSNESLQILIEKNELKLLKSMLSAYDDDNPVVI